MEEVEARMEQRSRHEHGRAKLEQCTTAGMQEVERLRRQSRGAIVEDVESGRTRQICREQFGRAKHARRELTKEDIQEV
jgi:hypothetical protein